MNYLELIKRAFQITFQHRLLWIFGLFVGMVGGNFYGGGLNFNNVQHLVRKKEIIGSFQNFQNFLTSNFFWIVLVSLILFLALLVFIFLNTLSQSALISLVNKIEKKEKIKISDGISIGLARFWKILGINILFSCFISLVLVILGTPIFLLFILEMPLRGLLLLFFAIIIFVPLACVFSFVLNYSYRYIVIQKKTIFNSIQKSFQLLSENIIPTLIIFLILIGINFAASLIFGIVLLCLVLFLGIPLFLLGLVLHTFLGIISSIILAIFGILVLTAFSFLFSAILNTYNSTLWTLVFRELTK